MSRQYTNTKVQAPASVDFGNLAKYNRLEQPFPVDAANEQVFLPQYGGTIFIARLPDNLTSSYEEFVKWLVEERLHLGKTRIISVYFENNKHDGKLCASATVEFQFWYFTQEATTLAGMLDRAWGQQHDVLLTNVFRNPAKETGWLSVNDDAYFVNGNYMTFLRIHPMMSNLGLGARPSIEQMPRIALEGKDTWMSIFIPHIPDGLMLGGSPVTSETLAWIFEHCLQIGHVKRIEYIQRAPSAVDGKPSNVRSAFIHFDYWIDTYNARRFRSTLELKGAWKMHGCFAYTGYNRAFEVRNSETGSVQKHYITMKINHSPIPDASPDLNVHQLAVAKTALEQQVLLLLAENKRLETELAHWRSTTSAQEPGAIRRCNASDEFDDVPPLAVVLSDDEA